MEQVALKVIQRKASTRSSRKEMVGGGDRQSRREKGGLYGEEKNSLPCCIILLGMDTLLESLGYFLYGLTTSHCVENPPAAWVHGHLKCPF